MDHATQIALMRRIFGFLDSRSTEMSPAPYINDVSTYTSADQLRRERALLFRREPQFVGLSCDAGEPGAYFTHEDTGVPILVVRDKSGELKAFLALCRHRGAQLVSGSGRSLGRFTCPYHAWVYNDGGELIGLPCAEGFEGVDAASLRLQELAVTEQYGMIFVRPSGSDVIDIETHLGGAEREIAALGLHHYAPFARHESVHAMNWKLVVDTFLEAYHVPSLHSSTLGGAILGAPAAWDAFGRGGRMVAVRRSIIEARDKPEAQWNLLKNSVVLYQLFPNTVLIHQIDHVEIVQAYPCDDTPDRAKVVFTLYTPQPATGDSARRHFQRNFDLLIGVSEKEDFGVGAQIQRGFHAGGPQTIVYGRNEPALAHYHRAIHAALAQPRP